MARVLSSLLKGVPLGCLVAGVVLSLLAGGWWWFVLGALAAVALVAPKHLSARNRLIERAAAATGQPDERRLADLHELASSVAAVQGIPGAEQPAMQLRDQFDAVNAKYLNFRDLLAAKFDRGEMTFGRYAKSAEQVYLSALDEVQNAATMLAGLRAIDGDQIRAQVRILKRLEAPTEAQARELAALEQRMALRDAELAAVRDLLSKNEQSLTTLTLAGTALTKLQTEDGRTALDSDTAMRELEELASRAERYSLTSTRAQPVAPNDSSGRADR